MCLGVNISKRAVVELLFSFSVIPSASIYIAYSYRFGFTPLSPSAPARCAVNAMNGTKKSSLNNIHCNAVNKMEESLN